MLQRKQFTFYRSFWEAVKVLPKKDRLPILEAIISYALDGAEPSGLTQSQAALFSLVRPNLNTARRKAEGGSGKTPTQDSGKIPARCAQDAVNKKEKEKEVEKEIEIEGEKEKEDTAPALTHSGKPFTTFWDAYPNRIGREDAWAAWKALNPSPTIAGKILSSLDAWKKSGQWTEDGGRFIPSAAKFLAKGYWRSTPPPASAKRNIPTGASGELGEAEMEALRRVLAQDFPDEEVPL